jgi:hypothetical protein
MIESRYLTCREQQAFNISGAGAALLPLVDRCSMVDLYSFLCCAERCIRWAHQPWQHVLHELDHPVSALGTRTQRCTVVVQATGRHRFGQQSQAGTGSQGALQGARYKLQACDAFQFPDGTCSCPICVASETMFNPYGTAIGSEAFGC